MCEGGSLCEGLPRRVCVRGFPACLGCVREAPCPWGGPEGSLLVAASLCGSPRPGLGVRGAPGASRRGAERVSPLPAGLCVFSSCYASAPRARLTTRGCASPSLPCPPSLPEAAAWLYTRVGTAAAPSPSFVSPPSAGQRSDAAARAASCVVNTRRLGRTPLAFPAWKELDLCQYLEAVCSNLP